MHTTRVGITLQSCIMAAFSETYYYQKYRDSFSVSQNTEALVELFKSASTIFSESLMTDLSVLTPQELSEFRKHSRGVRVSERRETQARDLIETVRHKDCLRAYRGFRIFAKREAQRSGQIEVVNKVFPFGDKEDNDGLAPAIVTKGAQPAAVPVQSTRPTVLWMTSTRTEFDIVKQSLNLQQTNTSTRFGFLYEETTVPLSGSASIHSMNDLATLFLVCPEAELSGPSPFKQLLINFSPRPHLAVMTGPCLPLVPGSNVKESDVVVVTCETPQAIEGEIQYLTELWRLKGELNKIFSGGKPIVLFGRATKTMGEGAENGFIVNCPKAVQFYAAAKQVEGLEYLAVVQVAAADSLGAIRQSTDHDKMTSAKYVYEIILNIARAL